MIWGVSTAGVAHALPDQTSELWLPQLARTLCGNVIQSPWPESVATRSRRCRCCVRKAAHLEQEQDARAAVDVSSWSVVDHGSGIKPRGA
jgi:hypothetical protein